MTHPAGTRQDLGRRLRAHRKAAAIEQIDLAEVLPVTQGQISRIENGKRRVPPELVGLWLRACSAPEEAVAELVALAERADTEVTAWKERFANGWDADQRTYEDLEHEALAIRSYQISVIPGLLTTPAYVEFLLRRIVRLPDDDVAKGVAARMRRQELLYRPSTRYHVVLAEHVLRHRLGGAAMTAEQLHHIVRLAALPTVDLAVIPTNTEMPQPYLVSFDLFELPDDDAVVLIELDTGEVRETQPARVARYTERHQALRAAALTGSAALDFVKQIADEITGAIFKGSQVKEGEG